MSRFTLNLPTRKRIKRGVAHVRALLDMKPLLPDLGTVLRARNGSKLSRYFRHIFEDGRIKRILGANLAFVVVASSFIPSAHQPEIIDASGFTTDESALVLAEAPVVLTTERKIRYPLEYVVINQGYRFYHPGVDFEGITGDSVYPIMPGEVAAVGYSKIGYGNAIVVRHDDNTTSLYAHLNKILVDEGEYVNTHDIIGLVGSTGRSSGDHLHLEVRKSDNTPINPLSILPALK